MSANELSAADPSRAFRLEVERGERFEFGANWARFLETLTERRIEAAEASLRALVGAESLEGRSFADVGSGSGVFSLAARRLGARVHSFDYDPSSVGCTQALRERHAPNDPLWTVERGSVLDADYVAGLGTFDVVYSWGVLHHTGDMRTAFANVRRLVAPGGRLAIAIYNDQGGMSRRWRALKRVYNRLPAPLRLPYAAAVMGPREALFLGKALATASPGRYVRSWTAYGDGARGMSRWHDLIDWIGGYPFEVAKPEEVFDVFRPTGMTLVRMRTCAGSIGCNEFVFAAERGAEA